VNGVPGLLVTQEQEREKEQGSVIPLPQIMVDLHVLATVKFRNHVQSCLMVGGVDGDHGVLVIKRQESIKNQESATTPTLEMGDQAAL